MDLLAALGCPVDARIVLTGAGSLPSPFHVSKLADATVAAANLAIAELHAVRAGVACPAVTIDRGEVAAAFRSERHFTPLGWALPPLWDPIAGDYPTSDGWVRIHTNYAHHRAAALRALEAPEERDAVARAVARRTKDDVERAIVLEGGAAAAVRTLADWAEHPQGRAVADEPIVAREDRGPARPLPPGRALEGVRVLDLTRVIAGPVGTRVLAAYGATVLRLDPPGFAEVPVLLGDVTGGKYRAPIDLRTPGGKALFERLAAEADVLVCGYRPEALASRGIALDALPSSLSIVQLDAYGWSGPWRGRRGFDSLVQASSGIAARCGSGKPGVLPAQALDHGSGYLVAAAVCRALALRAETGRSSLSRLSLARLARVLVDLGDDADPHAGIVESPRLHEVDVTGLGRARRARVPGEIAGLEARWDRLPGPLGVDEPRWPE